MEIDKKKHRIDKDNRYGSVTKKTQIVLALSLRKENYHLKRLEHKDYGKSKNWNTYTITRGGEIFEHYDPKYYTDFLGIKQADKRSISIVLENMGSLLRDNEGNYINWLNEKCDSNNVIEKRWMGQKYWEDIYQELRESLKYLCEKLCNDFEIPNKTIEFHHYNKDTIKFNGIVYKSNYFEDSSNVNPLLTFN